MRIHRHEIQMNYMYPRLNCVCVCAGVYVSLSLCLCDSCQLICVSFVTRRLLGGETDRTVLMSCVVRWTPLSSSEGFEQEHVWHVRTGCVPLCPRLDAVARLLSGWFALV